MLCRYSPGFQVEDDASDESKSGFGFHALHPKWECAMHRQSQHGVSKVAIFVDLTVKIW